MAEAAATPIHVQVCYALPKDAILIDLEIASGTTLEQAVRQSGVLSRAPGIDLSTCKVGIFGKLRQLDAVPQDRDRIEIYRPLVADPKEARRRRVIKKENKKAR